MSQPSFEPAGGLEAESVVESEPQSQPTSKQSLNIYTMMLVISFIAMLAGTFMLLLELRKWGNFPNEQPWNTNSGKINLSQVDDLSNDRIDIDSLLV